jgi:hypothetical protein
VGIGDDDEGTAEHGAKDGRTRSRVQPAGGRRVTCTRPNV